jgi:hypothetical protein
VNGRDPFGGTNARFFERTVVEEAARSVTTARS